MARKPLIAGNWKMHLTIAEAEQLAGSVVSASTGMDDRDVMIAPPYTALAQIAKVVVNSHVILASQNVHWEASGAFTGEISPTMLKDLDCHMAIIGHSERRHIFGESDRIINQRILGAMEHDIIPVFCIGETLEERETERTLAVLEAQLEAGLMDVSLSEQPRLVIAYEPVWAIGTGKTASEEQAQEVHAFIRDFMGSLFEKNIAAQIRILYGGSVKPDNIDILMKQEDIDGVLVGGAALKTDSFARIIQFQ